MKEPENYLAKGDHGDVVALLVAQMGAYCACQKVRAPAPKKRKKGKKINSPYAR